MCFFCILGYIVQKKSAQKNTLNGYLMIIWCNLNEKCDILIIKCWSYLFVYFPSFSSCI